MKKISKNTENNIISLIDNGQSSWKIAEQLGISHTSVMRVSTRLQPNAQKKKAGRPAKLTTTDKRNIIRNLTSGKADTTVQLARDLKDSVQVDISPDTVHRMLKETGMKAVTKKKKPCLQSRHIRQRLDFAKWYQY